MKKGKREKGKGKRGKREKRGKGGSAQLSVFAKSLHTRVDNLAHSCYLYASFHRANVSRSILRKATLNENSYLLRSMYVKRNSSDILCL